MLVRRAFFRSAMTSAAFLAFCRNTWAAGAPDVVHDSLRQHLPEKELDRPLAPAPDVYRGSSSRAAQVYQRRANGVVLIAGENSIGTGVLISSSGDIVTNEHVVRDAHKERGAEWEAVWFKPSGNA